MTNCPSEYICELSGEIMVGEYRPAIDPTTGSSYSLAFLKEWLSRNPTSPSSRQPLTEDKLILNLTLEKAIEEWVKDNSSRSEKFNEDDMEVTFLKKGDYGMINMRCKDKSKRDNVHVVLNIDTSSSTNKRGNNSETSKLSVLDMEKHASLAFINGLTQNDFVSLVVFDTDAKVVFKKLKMDDTGKLEAKNYINKLVSRGCTNMNSGIEKSMKILEEEERFNGLNKMIITLTDGEPYVAGGFDSIANTITHCGDLYGLLNSDLERDLYPNHTLGFGNNINYKLLQVISKKSNAHSFYISDISMLPTVFLNSMSLFLTTAIKNIKVKVESDKYCEFDMTKCIMDNYEVSSDSMIVCKIPTISYGGEYNIVVPLEKNTFRGKFTFSGNTNSSKLERTINFHSNSRTGLPRIGYSTSIEENYLRLLFVSTLRKGIKYMENRCDTKAEKLIRKLQEDWEDIYNGKIDDENGSSSELYKDLCGQVFEAFNMTSDINYYEKWGKNYLPSLSHSHLNMLYSNFKDMGLTVYDTGEIFKETLDILKDKFVSLPPPKPSPSSYNYSYSVPGGNSHTAPPRSVPPPDMNSFVANSQSVPCYDEECYAEMADGTKKQLSDLKKGDEVLTNYRKETAKIVAILKTPINGKITLVSFLNGLLITEWHPMRKGGSGDWFFPADLCECMVKVNDDEMPVGGATKIEKDCKAIYSFLLDSGHTIFIGDGGFLGHETVTLGHNLEGLPKHPYFGGKKVIEDVLKHVDSEGVAICKGTVKNEDGLVCGLKF